jgi:hypothetical protein
MDLATRVVPNWRRNPATVDPPKGVDDFIERSNKYFEECVEADTRPTITGYALAVGLPGPTSLIRLGQRIPDLRYVISRCMMAISAEYEEMLSNGSCAGALFMLKNIPDFDPDESVGAPPVQFFNDRKEILLQSNVVGAARSDAEFDDEDPLETYIRLIRQRGLVKEAPPSATTTQRATYQPRRAIRIISEGWENE